MNGVAGRRRVERQTDHVRHRRRQLERRVDRLHAVLPQQIARARVDAIQKRVQVREQVRRLGEVVALAADRDGDHRHARIDGGDHLQKAPRPRQDLGRLHDHEHVAVAHGVEKLSQIPQIVAVQEALLLDQPLELRLQEAGLHRARSLVVRQEAGEPLAAAAFAPLHHGAVRRLEGAAAAVLVWRRLLGRRRRVWPQRLCCK